MILSARSTSSPRSADANEAERAARGSAVAADRVGSFAFKLELEDGRAADPPTLKTAVPKWNAGDTIPLGRERTLRVIDVPAGTDDDEPVLVLEQA
jgi:hypothetical protein